MSASALAKTLRDVLSATASVATGIDHGLATVSPALNLIAGFFPGAASVIAAVQLAAPYIATVAKYAPTARDLIEAGTPVFEAFDKASPDLLHAVKGVFASLTNGDPTKTESHMTPEQVSDRAAVEFAGPLIMGRPWTHDELARWWDAQNARN